MADHHSNTRDGYVIKLSQLGPDRPACPGPVADAKAPPRRGSQGGDDDSDPGEGDEDGDANANANSNANANANSNTDVSSLTALLQSYLDQQNKDGVTWRHRLVLALLEQVDQGNLRAIQEVWLRLEGKPGASEPATAPSLVIDDELARKILQIGREQDTAFD
jgi:hypothetical protein